MYPARTCRDLHMCHPKLKSGNYWIDPNEGIPDDSIQVYCDFENNSTCIFPNNQTRSHRRKWFSGPDGYKWFGKELRGFGTVRRGRDGPKEGTCPSQLAFLRLLSDRARQNVTYHCLNSAAWSSGKGDLNHSIKIKGDNGVELHASSSNKFKPQIIRDDCHIKDGKWRQTIITVDTSKPHRLPVLDVAVFDIGGQGEEFGLDIGPVCFS
ncbi:predicted protein [Nematostella vectensis]|uniref:Fibrillar collagen NC1 domain-containing protein n=1 Tax=Nematostella vectensis TaxID=45351 RepID=A7RHK9_NEMVE|nr:predicted protein [Nematostella vectensis]|eukprot:XP_001641059.1 predicted protein [Nematostella vectensis]